MAAEQPTPEQAEALSRLLGRVASWIGNDLRSRRDPLWQWLQTRAAELGLSSAAAYANSLCEPDSPEVARLVNLFTVGHTWFFRDAAQLDLVALLFERCAAYAPPIHVWVAGCATGEEAYSVAMLAQQKGYAVDILATDVNTEALARARGGRYGLDALRYVPEAHRIHFKIDAEGASVTEAVQKKVRFATHNLMTQAPLPRPGKLWDLVLCRNVLIYFDAERARVPMAHIQRALDRNGYLLLSASEFQKRPSEFEVLHLGGHMALQRRRGVPTAPPVAAVPLPLPPPTPSPVPDTGLAVAMGAAAADLQSGRVAEARASAHAALQRNPLCLEALLIAGIAAHMKADHREAAESLRRALLLAPDLWPAAFYLARTLEHLGETAEAARAYRRVLSAHSRPLPIQPAVLLRLDLSHWRQEVVAIVRQRLRDLPSAAGRPDGDSGDSNG